MKSFTFIAARLASLAIADDVSSEDILQYKTTFDAITRPLADEGDLLAGYGLKGFYEFTKYYQNDDFYLIFGTEIQAV